MKTRSPSPQTPICANPHCRRRNIHARKRCQACYTFLRRHGRDAGPAEMGKRRRATKKCQNCKKRAVHARQRCRRCYEYWRRNGYERPSAGQRAKNGLCCNCGLRPPYRLGRCRSCYGYLRLHRQDRPRGQS